MPVAGKLLVSRLSFLAPAYSPVPQALSPLSHTLAHTCVCMRRQAARLHGFLHWLPVLRLRPGRDQEPGDADDGEPGAAAGAAAQHPRPLHWLPQLLRASAGDPPDGLWRWNGWLWAMIRKCGRGHLQAFYPAQRLQVGPAQRLQVGQHKGCRLAQHKGCRLASKGVDQGRRKKALEDAFLNPKAAYCCGTSGSYIHARCPLTQAPQAPDFHALTQHACMRKQHPYALGLTEPLCLMFCPQGGGAGAAHALVSAGMDACLKSGH